MFSGLTNQVSTWIGKKGEDDSVVPEEKVGSPGAGGDLDAEKKDNSQQGGGSKLEMLAGVKSQMTGWLSGGIPGLGRGAAGPNEGDAPVSGEINDNEVARDSAQGVTTDNVKDDDASRWVAGATGSADSGPASLEGTPTEDKDGQQAFGAVSTKALAGAKSLGGFLYSAVNKAGKSVVEASAKIKKTVEENRLIAELNKEQDAFIAAKPSEKGEAVAPWVGAPNEDALRDECLALSTDKRNFVRAPPPGVEFTWDFEAVQPMAQATLALDPNLEQMRFELVPKVISEENFWRNYFYRVSLLRQSHELNAMASQAESNPSQTLTSTGSIDQTQVISAQGTTEVDSSSKKYLATADSPSHEFVSDSVRASDTDIQEVREGMKKLGIQSPKEEDWERELEAELKDFEVVPGQGKSQSTATNSGKDDWEEQIDDLLGDVEDLK
ncbi:synapse-associated protein of 47 kDa isoform X2 [Leptopilina heterotoma]|uniref:synapse-associated protein of 47 kDa isoform X2 n=1 Tax=Leptopilina heterotoma TaxID=63436 RepID=UPI001CA9F9C9|nr:synapse-associated protein of 47 kDa isoform X2 [Leptopilina heterotoma]